MKNLIITLLFLLVSVAGISQSLHNDKYEIYLLKFEENEVNIAKGMYMTNNKQYYYEGSIEVLFLENGDTKTYNYFFSSWDDKYKEFIIKDANNSIVKPKIAFKDKEMAYITNDGKESDSMKLKNNSTIEYSIMSSMIIWLDNK